MATNFFGGSYPVDQPRVSAPGVLHREADAPGNASHLALPADAPLRREKGDLGLTTIVGLESRATTSGKPPFVLKGGR